MEPIPREGSREGGSDAEEGGRVAEGGGDGEEVVKLPSVAERISQMETQQNKDKLPVSSVASSAALSVYNSQ